MTNEKNESNICKRMTNSRWVYKSFVRRIKKVTV